MGVFRSDNVLVVQLQGADKSRLQLGKKVKGAAQERHMAADGFSAGKAADSLVYHCLKNRRRQVFLCRALIDQRLNVRFCKYTAAGRDGVKGMIVFGILVQAGSVRLKKRSHLVNEGACTAGADAVHTLFHIAALKINDFRVLAAQLNSHIGLGRCFFKGCRYGHNLLDEGHFQVPCQSQAAGTGDSRVYSQVAKLPFRLFQKIGQGLLDICEMTLVI